MPDSGRYRDLAGLAPQLVQAIIQWCRLAKEGIHGQGSYRIRPFEQRPALLNGPDSVGGRKLRSVQESQALLGPQIQGWPSELVQDVPGRKTLTLPIGLSLADEDQGQMGQWGQIARCTEGSLGMNDRPDAGIEQVDHQLQGIRPHTGKAQGQIADLEQLDQVIDRRRYLFSRTTGMGEDEIALQLFDILR